jgi:hypothetical protein
MNGMIMKHRGGAKVQVFEFADGTIRATLPLSEFWPRRPCALSVFGI